MGRQITVYEKKEPGFTPALSYYLRLVLYFYSCLGFVGGGNRRRTSGAPCNLQGAFQMLLVAPPERVPPDRRQFEELRCPTLRRHIKTFFKAGTLHFFPDGVKPSCRRTQKADFKVLRFLFPT